MSPMWLGSLGNHAWSCLPLSFRSCPSGLNNESKRNGYVRDFYKENKNGKEMNWRRDLRKENRLNTQTKKT